MNDKYQTPTDDQPTVPAQAAKKDQLYVGLTGSKLGARKQRRPIGIYLLAVVYLLIFINIFFGTSTNILALTQSILSLLAGIGLLLRWEAARKFVIALSILAIMANGFGLYMLANAYPKFSSLRNASDTSIKNNDALRNSRTVDQNRSLDEALAIIDEEHDKLMDSLRELLITMTVGILTNIIVLAYITRPKVKQSFHRIPK